MSNEKPVRVYIDGCFDLMHFGHANAMRQAKLLGDELVAGVASDAEIVKRKGPPVLTQQERCKLVKAVKWVDEVIEGVTYDTAPADLDVYGCDFSVHGDDPVMGVDGVDPYKEVCENSSSYGGM